MDAASTNVSHALSLFFYGLVFFAAAAVCLRLYRTTAYRNLWGWMVAFTATMGLNQWILLVENAFGHPISLAGIRLFTLGMAYVFLCEGGRTGLQDFWRLPVERWIYFPLLCLCSLGGIAGIEGIEAMLTYCFCLPGGLAASAALLGFWKTERTPVLPVIAAALAVFTVLNVLAVPDAPFFPASWINAETLRRLLGFPLFRLQGVAGLVLALSLTVEAERSVRAHERSLGLQPRTALFVFMSLLFSVMALYGAVTVHHYNVYTEIQTRTHLLSRIRTIAASIKPEKVQALLAAPMPGRSTQFAEIQDQLRAIAEVQTDINFLYLLGLHRDTIVFCIHSNPQRFPMDLSVTQAFSQRVIDTLRNPEQYRQPILEEYSGQTHSMSSIVPIRQPANGNRVLAWLGANLDTQNYWRPILVHRILSFSILMLLLLALLILIMVQEMFRISSLRMSASEKRFRQLFTEMKNLFSLQEVICAPEGAPCDFRFLEVNPAFEKMFSLRKAEIIGRTGREVFPALPPEWFQRVGAVAVSGKPVHFEYTFPARDATLDITAYCPRHGQVALIAEDITLRSLSQKALRESEEKYRNLFHNAQVGVFRVSEIDGTVIDANERLSLMFGYASLDAFKETYSHASLFPSPESLIQFQKGFKNLFMKDFDVQMSRVDGTTLWLLISARLYPERHCFEGIAVDVTQRKLAEKQLRESQKRYEALSEGAPVGVFQTDAQGHCIYANEQMCSIMGLSFEKITSLGWTHLIHTEDRDRVLAHLEQCRQKLAAFKMEFRIQRFGGDTVWVIGQATPYTDSESTSRLLGYVGTFTDITDLKEAESRQMESQKLFQTIIDNIPVAVFMKESTNLTFTLWNKASELLFGYPAQTMYGKTDYDFFPREQSDFFISKDRDTLTQGRVVDIPEEPITVAGGAQKVLHTRKVPITDAQGLPRYLLGISEDITETKRLFESLQENEEKYRSILNNAQVSFFRSRMDTGEILEANTRMANMLGYGDVKEMLGRYAPGHHLFDREAFARALKENGGTVHNFEVHARRADGTPAWGLVSARAIPEKNLIDGVIVEITERKKMEETITRAQRLFRTYFDLPEAALAVTGADKGFIDFNESFCALTGYGAEELRTMRWNQLETVEGLPGDEALYAKVLAGELDHARFRRDLLRKDGEKLPVAVAFACGRNPDGTLDHLVFLVQDLKKIIPS